RLFKRNIELTPLARSAAGRRRAGQAAPAVDALRLATKAYLRQFLASGPTLTFSPVHDPIVSVVVVGWNQADLTIRCLRSLQYLERPAEVVVVDNASTDETASLLERMPGLTVLRNPTNVGFTVA